jgi:hypothetical protein
MPLNVYAVLRRLMEAATHFERVAAHHQRIEPQRKALQEAITEAQLVLSVQEREKPQIRGNGERRNGHTRSPRKKR